MVTRSIPNNSIARSMCAFLGTLGSQWLYYFQHYSASMAEESLIAASGKPICFGFQTTLGLKLNHINEGGRWWPGDYKLEIWTTTFSIIFPPEYFVPIWERLILGLHPTNERRRYKGTPSLIGNPRISPEYYAYSTMQSSALHPPNIYHIVYISVYR